MAEQGTVPQQATSMRLGVGRTHQASVSTAGLVREVEGNSFKRALAAPLWLDGEQAMPSSGSASDCDSVYSAVSSYHRARF